MKLAGSPLSVIEDVTLGQQLPEMRTPPLTTLHLVRWAAATEQWHRINFDRTFAIEHDGLPGTPINGTFKRQFMAQYLSAVFGNAGWLDEFEIQFRRLNIAGDALTAWAIVSEITIFDGYGELSLRVGIRDQAGNETSPGTARGVLPCRGGIIPFPRPL